MSETKNISLHGLRTFLQPLIRLINRKAESWEDLKGKPFGSKMEEVELLKNTQFYAGDQWMPLGYFAFVEGQNYTVIFDGETYNCIAYRDKYGTIDIGDITLAGDNHPQSQDAPFFIYSDEGYGAQIFFENPDIDHTISISTNEEVIKKLDSKYIDVDLPEGILTQDNYLETTAGMQVGDNGEIFNNYDANVASGYMSHAEGSGTTASGMYSHAEGQNTEANGRHSHAEGYQTHAYKEASHAEGGVVLAYGEYSHAEGQGSNAYGNYSHAENRSNALKSYSHAEGYETVANGENSHAEGRQTLACEYSSHAEGAGLGFNVKLDAGDGTGTYSYYNLESNYSEAEILKCTKLYCLEKVYDIKSINTQEKKITLTEKISFSAPFVTSEAFLFQSGAFSTYSHVEGFGTIAKGLSSHAEGSKSQALEDSSHAEGSGSIALGRCSHAEGSGQASTLTLSGSGKVYTYSNAAFTPTVGDIIYYSNLYHFIDSVDTANSTITLDSALSSSTISSIVVPHYQGVAYGTCAHKEGTYSNAIGGDSHAEGYGTVARANNSHTEGSCTIASGNQSHAEGEDSVAKGVSSHAEGRQTTANGDYSHAEGFNTTADSHQSHAEGSNTTASAKYSHSEGYFTTASGQSSHAEGGNTISSGSSSHAEGTGTIASGMRSHAEGQNTEASASYSHAEGYNTFARGSGSHTEGYGDKRSIKNVVGEAGATTYTYSPTSIGNDEYFVLEGDYVQIGSEIRKVIAITKAYSTTSGNSFTVSSTFSPTEAINTNAHILRGIANGQASHTEGYYNIASGDYSHAEGECTHATAMASHAEGYYTYAMGGYGSHSEGMRTKAFGQGSHAEGYYTNAIGDYSHAKGKNTRASGVAAYAEGEYTYSVNNSSHAEGYNTCAAGQYAHAEGYSDTSYNGLYLSGEPDSLVYNYSISGSGWRPLINGIIILDAVIATIVNVDENSQTVTLSQTLSSEALSEKQVILCNNGAFGQASHVEGYNTIACSTYQHVQGKRNIADTAGNYAHIVGNGTALTRSNAHTLDWNGNGWFAGDVYVGGTGQDDAAAKKVLTEGAAHDIKYIPDGDSRIIPSGADLNSYTTPGDYRCASADISSSLVNAPSYTSSGFRLIVTATSTASESCIQTAVFNTVSAPRIYWRIYSTSSSSWSPWYHMGSMEYGTAAYTAGTTALPTGTFYFQYE